jgi:hypothetical protein
MTQADSVLSTPPLNTPTIDHPPPRAPASQERADERLARVAGVPAAVRGFLMADRELTPQEVLEDLLGSEDFPVVIVDTRAAAWIILRRLFDAGFEIMPAE